jgi:hypothetical protein
MPGDVRGNLVRVLGYTETAYKTPGASGNLLYFTQFGVKPARDRVQSQTLAGRRGQQRSMDGAKTVDGPLGIEIAPETIGFALKHLVGTPTTTGSGPYTHVFEPAISGAKALPPGLALESDYGAVMSGTARILRGIGCRIADGAFQLSANGIPTLRLNVLGADHVQSDTPLDATPTDTGHTGFSAANQVITINTSAPKNICLNQITLNWSNDLDGDKYCASAGGVRDGLPEGFAIVGGSCDMFLDHEDVLQQVLSGADTNLRLLLSRGTGLGTVGNESLQIDLGAIVFEITGPTIEGPKGVRVQANFHAHATGTSELAATFTLKNSVAAYV